MPWKEKILYRLLDARRDISRRKAARIGIIRMTRTRVWLGTSRGKRPKRGMMGRESDWLSHRVKVPVLPTIKPDPSIHDRAQTARLGNQARDSRQVIRTDQGPMEL